MTAVTVVRQYERGGRGGAESPSAVDKAMLVLACVTASETPLRLSDIARRTGLPKSTVHRLLAVLSLHQAIRRSGELYVAGAMVMRAADAVGGALPHTLRHVVTPHLVELHAATRRCVGLAVLRGFHVESLAALYSSAYEPAAPHAGGEVPAERTAAGRLLLAHVPDPPGDCGSKLERVLADIRCRGIAREDGEFRPGVVGLAAPVTGADGRLLAAISVTGFRGEFPTTRIEPLLRRTAYAASLSLRTSVRGRAKDLRPRDGHPEGVEAERGA
jgi:DNA-binding IclR family transcriptional regulator